MNWAIYWAKSKDVTMSRLKVTAASFAEAIQEAKAKLPEDARIIDCEPVGVRK